MNGGDSYLKLVFCVVIAGDWLQGPYVYYLYTTYGFGKGDIGQLFIAGFGSSMLFGTIVGSLADKQYDSEFVRQSSFNNQKFLAK